MTRQQVATFRMPRAGFLRRLFHRKKAIYGRIVGSEGIKMVKASAAAEKRRPTGFTLESLLEEEGEFMPPKKR